MVLLCSVTNGKEERNMKMMKILPSVILASLLMTGCTLFGGESYNVKKYKNEVTCEEFYEAFNKGSAETAKIPASIPPEGFDASINGSIKYVGSMTSKFDGKQIRKNTSSSNEKINAEYDADNRMGHSKVNDSMKIEYQIQYGEMVETAEQNVKSEFYGKETQKSETEYTVDIASVKEEKVNTFTYTYASFASSFISRATSRLGFSRIPVISPTGYEAMSEEEKSRLKFYNDNGVLTAVVTASGNDEDENSKTTYNGTLVAQVSFAENKLSYVIKDEGESKTTYLNNVDEYLKDEVVVTKTNQYYKATIDTSAVSLEFDYSNYGKGNYTISSMFPSTGF